MSSCSESSIRSRLALERRVDSPNPIITAENKRNPTIPDTSTRSITNVGRSDVRNHTHIPKTEVSAFKMEGPRPQYHAENATAAHAVRYRFRSPINGVSQTRS